MEAEVLFGDLKHVSVVIDSCDALKALIELCSQEHWEDSGTCAHMEDAKILFQSKIGGHEESGEHDLLVLTCEVVVVDHWLLALLFGT